MAARTFPAFLATFVAESHSWLPATPSASKDGSSRPAKDSKAAAAAHAAIDRQITDIVGLFLRDFILPWFGAVSANEDFLCRLLDTLRCAVLVLSQRLHGVDWVRLLAVHLPRLLATHQRDFRLCRERQSSWTADTQDCSVSLAAMFHTQQPHPALRSPADEAVYARRVIDSALQILLQPPHVDGSSAAAIYRPVPAEVTILFGDALTWLLIDGVELLSEPRHLADLMFRLILDDDSERIRRPIPLQRAYNRPTGSASSVVDAKLHAATDSPRKHRYTQSLPLTQSIVSSPPSSPPIRRRHKQVKAVHATWHDKSGDIVRGHGRAIGAFITKIAHDAGAITAKASTVPTTDNNHAAILNQQMISEPTDEPSRPDSSLSASTSSSCSSTRSSTSSHSSTSSPAVVHISNNSSSLNIADTVTKFVTNTSARIVALWWALVAVVHRFWSFSHRLNLEIERRSDARHQLGPIPLHGEYDGELLDAEWWSLVNVVFELDRRATWLWFFLQAIVRPLLWVLFSPWLIRLFMWVVWCIIKPETICKLMGLAKESIWPDEEDAAPVSDPPRTMTRRMRRRLIRLLISFVPRKLHGIVGGKQTVVDGVRTAVDGLLSDPVITRHLVWSLFDLAADLLLTERYSLSREGNDKIVKKR